jgi:molybdate transport system permease protein
MKTLRPSVPSCQPEISPREAPAGAPPGEPRPKGRAAPGAIIAARAAPRRLPAATPSRPPELPPGAGSFPLSLDLNALLLSLELAASTAAILLALGLPLAAWLAFSNARWKPLVEAVVALPIVLPPTVLGFYVLLLLGPNGPVGRAVESLFGARLPFTFEGLLVASVLYSLPFAVQPFAASFAAVDRTLLDAAAALGAPPLETFRRVVLPLSRPGVVTGVVLSFAHTLGEFGVVLMVGGNIPGETRTVSVAIYDDVQALDYAAAGTTSLLLLGISFAVLAATYALQRRTVAAWPLRSKPAS